MINSVESKSNNVVFENFSKPNVSFIKSNDIKNDSFELSKKTDDKQTKKTSYLKPALIAVGVAVLGAGAFILGKGKSSSIKISAEQISQLNELVNKGDVKQETVDLMLKLLKDGKLTPQKLYKSICEYMNIKKAPELNIVDINQGAMGIYNPNKGNISFPENTSIGTMFHELTHFQQFQKVYRAFGKDAMIDAQVEKMHTRLKTNPKYAEHKLGKPFDKASAEEIGGLLEKEKARLNSEFNEDFYKKVAEANGELSQKELEEAKLYLDAIKCPDHNATIIEREAYHNEIVFENEVSKINKVLRPKKR